MKPYKINFINSLTLIVLGLWGYFSSDNPSATALIPVFSGTILLVITPAIKNANKVMAHIAVTLTLLILVALIKPLTGGIARNDDAAVFRVILMMLTCTIAMVIYIKSFIDARKIRG